MADPKDLSLDDEEILEHGESDESLGEADGDEGQEDALGGDEGEDDEEDGARTEEGDGQEDRNEEGRQVARKPGRGAARFQALSERAKAAEDRAERAERDAAEARRLAEQRAVRETEEDERQRVALMSDNERFDHYRQKDRRELDQKLFAMEFRSADSADRAAFESKAARIPALGRIAAEVEKTLAKARAAGGNPTRELIAQVLIGQRALERAPAAGTRQGKTAAIERQRQAARPGGGRGEVSADRRGGKDSASARAKRLEGLEI